MSRSCKSAGFRKKNCQRLILQWVDDSSLANGKEDWLVFKYDVVVVVVISVIVLVIVIF